MGYGLWVGGGEDILTVEADLLDEFGQQDVHGASHAAADVGRTTRDVTCAKAF